jgi:hypothetical protein
MSKPDEVVAVRYVRLHSRGKPRLEARCKWHARPTTSIDGEAGGREEWLHATRKALGNRAFVLAKRLERTLAQQQAGANAEASASKLRVTTRAAAAKGRGREREADEEAGKINPPRRRRPLAIIEEDDEREASSEAGSDREGEAEEWRPGCSVA